MLQLLKKMQRREVIMTLICAVFVVGQVYFDLRLPDYIIPPVLRGLPEIPLPEYFFPPALLLPYAPVNISPSAVWE